MKKTSLRAAKYRQSGNLHDMETYSANQFILGPPYLLIKRLWFRVVFPDKAAAYVIRFNY